MPAFFRLRTRLLAAAYLAVFVVAHVMSYMLRFEFSLPDVEVPAFAHTVFLSTGAKLVVFYAFGQYRSSLGYAGIQDMKKIVLAATVSSVVLGVYDKFIAVDIFVPRSILLLDWLLTIALCGFLRIGPRVLREGFRMPRRLREATRVFIAGAGDAGESLLREISRRPEVNYFVAGFLDDDPHKRGGLIGGVPVLGPIKNARRYAEQYDVRNVLIAIPSASGAQMRKIVAALRKGSLGFKTLPHVAAALSSDISPALLREVTIEEILGREPVRLAVDVVRRLVSGKVIAVTGAAGSIGSEMCRQVLKFGPARLLMIDWCESSLFYMERELASRPGAAPVVPIVADINDAAHMEQVFSGHRPGVVFHAAAYKHVPLMEQSVCEAVRNNVFGTKTVVDAAVRLGVERFVLISTDKAVRPVSVMGMTKRLAELYVRALGAARGASLVAVRFGNVLGSVASVVPIFKRQIETGGPVTVTHEDMTRFFMTIPEATGLVLQAAAIGGPGDVLVLDMGEPVKIVDLARELIGLSGLREPEDIRIEFTGVRPGEKMHEELFAPDEDRTASSHEKVWMARGAVPRLGWLEGKLEALREKVARRQEPEVRRLLAELAAGEAEEADA